MQMKTRFILLIAVIILSPAILYSQDSAEERDKINRIKGDSEFIYADEYGETREEADELAGIMLEAAISRIIVLEEIGSLQQEKIKDNLNNHVQTIALNVDGIFRTFKYISRMKLFSTEPTERSNEPVATNMSEKEPVAPTAITTQPDSAIRIRTDNVLLEKILEITTIERLEPFLKTEREEGTLMYGAINSLSNLENAYLIVFSQTGVVEAVLSKGKTTRQNYLTGSQSDNLSNYPGKGVVWVMIY
jgi:hypothetical protein